MQGTATQTGSSKLHSTKNSTDGLYVVIQPERPLITNRTEMFTQSKNSYASDNQTLMFYKEAIYKVQQNQLHSLNAVMKSIHLLIIKKRN